MDTKTAIRRHPALGQLGDADLETLVAESTLERFSRGATIWRSGETARCFSIMAYGLVKLVMSTGGLRDFVVGVFGPGDSVADSIAIEGSAQRTDAIALTEPVLVARVPRDLALHLLRENGSASMAFARALSYRAAAATRRVSIACATVEVRLASTFLELAEEFGDELVDGTLLIPVRLSRSELASMVGTTVETTTRTMARWSREGVLATVPGGFNVLDVETLKRRAARLAQSDVSERD